MMALVSFTLATLIVDAGIVALLVAASRRDVSVLWAALFAIVLGLLGMRATRNAVYRKDGE